MTQARSGWAPDEERRKWQNPEGILSLIGLRVGHTFVDLGCGDGFFAIPAARLVGETGKVYGVDTDVEAMGRLREKAAKAGLKNLNLTVGKAEDVIVCQECADIVFFGIVLHDFSAPSKVLMNAKEMLKPSGRLINLDWKKESMEWGPPLQIRFSEDHASKLIEAAGFKAGAAEPIGPFHYLIVGRL
jgi:ubiquinone/menaquinone biosynthesis C-methylase UbiE